MKRFKTHSIINTERARRSIQERFNPIRNLTPESLGRQLDEFHAGDLRQVAQTWEAIERRDDVIQGVVSKRKKAVARLDWEVLAADDSEEALMHKRALEFFYANLTATSAIDRNQEGGFSLLVQQMMDAVGKRYAVHEVVWQPMSAGYGGLGRGFRHISRRESETGARLTATFHFAPLWFFENHTGRLRFLSGEGSHEGTPLEPGSWLLTVGDGLMEATSVAYLFKHLPLRDWLIYCERNGMPGVRGITEAMPGSPEWEAARDAVEDFGAEFHALMNRGTEIEAIDLSARGELPYPKLVERMDRAIAALWRGADLSTISAQAGVGASVQRSETELLEHHDALMVADTLNAQVGRYVIKHLFGTDEVLARLRLKTGNRQDIERDLKVYEHLWRMGAPVAVSHILERFSVPAPGKDEATLTKQASR